jgi:aconitate hydratase
MADSTCKNTFETLSILEANSTKFQYHSLDILAQKTGNDFSRLPVSIRIIIENLLRNENGHQVTAEQIEALATYNPSNPPELEIPYKPSRVLLQDFTGVPAVVDLAALRSAMARAKGDPKVINPTIPVDLIVDHSVQVDVFGTEDALSKNVELEFDRNHERYQLLRWAQNSFDNFRVVPPASGICHQVNLEYIGQVVRETESTKGNLLFFDTCIGTDSHTPMIGGLGCLGWGVGGIEAEAVMLGQPLYMLAPSVIGVKLTGRLPEGSTATDLVLVVTETLRKKGVVGKFVEFYGQGLSNLTVPGRATIANMAPEYGATIGYFPVDELTLTYLENTGRTDENIECVKAYCEAQGIFRTDEIPDPAFEDTVEIDLGTIETCLAGPKRPQDRVTLSSMKEVWEKILSAPKDQGGFGVSEKDCTIEIKTQPLGKNTFALAHGSVVISAITSCTNTSNPSVMLAAGLLAKKAVKLGLATKPWIKTSLAPGSMVVTDYLQKTGLMPYLEKLGFHLVGYGCTTCIGNSGPLPEPVARAVTKGGLVGAAVLSGNRNFEGRINSLVQASYLASPPLVVAYALAGTVNIDLATEPLGTDANGNPVMLEDIWPTSQEIAELQNSALSAEVFHDKYEGIEQSNRQWNESPVSSSESYEWNRDSTYIQEPPFFIGMKQNIEPVQPIKDAQILVWVSDSVTTDHISPAGAIPSDSPAGKYLIENGVKPEDFNSYGSRRGNDRVMTRGTFANIRIRNRLAPGTEGGFTTYLLTGELMSVYEAAMKYKESNIPTIVIAGRDYGMGSSRDWAAKGTSLLGIRAVIAESFERIHRSNLVGMGVLPLQFLPGENAESLGITGKESFTITIDDTVKPGIMIPVEIVFEDNTQEVIKTVCRLDTPIDVEYYKNGGILQTVLRGLIAEKGQGKR